MLYIYVLALIKLIVIKNRNIASKQNNAQKLGEPPLASPRIHVEPTQLIPIHSQQIARCSTCLDIELR